MEQINVLVYGAGAVGIFFGGRLHQAGFNITFVDTPDRTEALADSRLFIDSNYDQNYDFEPVIVSDPSTLPPQDLILICVKAFKTYEIALTLIPVVKPSTITLSLQNGLENEKVLCDMIGKNLVLGAVPHFSGNLDEPNRVTQHAPAQIVFGELDHQPSKRVEWLSKIFAHADIDHKISNNITEYIWKKFIWNNAFNTISALTGSTIRQIYEADAVMPTIQLMMGEVQQVARAEGVEVSQRNLEELCSINPNYEHVKTSMLRDIENHRMPELEPLVGVLLQKAKKHGISTPVNETIYNLLQLKLSNAQITLEDS